MEIKKKPANEGTFDVLETLSKMFYLSHRAKLLFNEQSYALMP